MFKMNNQDPRIVRLKEIEQELQNIANSYAGNITGPIASELHGVESHLHQVIDFAIQGPTEEDWIRQLKPYVGGNENLAKTLLRMKDYE